MKKFLVILFLLGNLCWAQNKDMEQSIELPDFVITGVQSVDTPELKKPQIDFIPVLSKQFFNPVYQPEELNLTRIEAPSNESPEVFKNYTPISAELKLGAGIYTQPTGSFSISTVSSNMFLSAELWGTNIKDYEPYSDNNVIGGRIHSKIFVDNKSRFLPGLEVSIDAGLDSRNYNLFGSNILKQVNRSVLGGNGLLSISYNTDDAVSFSISGKADYTDMTGDMNSLLDTDINELLFTTNGSFLVNMNTMNLTGSAEYISSTYSDSTFSDDNVSYFKGTAKISYLLGNAISLDAGIFYSSYDSQSFFMPVFSGRVRINDFITLKAEIGGSSSFKGFTDLYKENPFIQPAMLHTAYTEKNLGGRFSVLYQLDKYVQVDCGVGYEKYDHFYYFSQNTNRGIFEISPLVNLKRLFAFGKAYFHLGPMGALYGGVEVQQFTMSDDNHIPYQPVVVSSLEYKYENKGPFAFSVKYMLNYKTYTDILNSDLLADLHDLCVSLEYKFSKNIILQAGVENILDNDNFVWDGYLQKPLDFIAGFRYQW